jgi:two-component system, OmpR family, response regulator
MRLLVVEDDVKLATAIGRGLRHAGYAVDVVGDGDAALAHAAVWDYDGIVLDLMLPGRDGLAVCRALRERGCWSPVVVLTARGRVGDRIEGLDSGADDYLAKPFDFGELLARLRAVMRRAPAERPVAIEIGDLRVDPAARTASRAGRDVPLTSREFAVLEYLTRHAGDVVTRADLLDHVWDANYEGSTNIVDQYVGSLRRKLGAPLIHTVRGAGFRLDP